VIAVGWRRGHRWPALPSWRWARRVPPMRRSNRASSRRSGMIRLGGQHGGDRVPPLPRRLGGQSPVLSCYLGPWLRL